MTVKCIYASSYRVKGGAPKTRIVEAPPPPDYGGALNAYISKLTTMQVAALADAANTILETAPGEAVGSANPIATIMGESAIAAAMGGGGKATGEGEGETGLASGSGRGGPNFGGEGVSGSKNPAYSGRGVNPHLLDVMREAQKTGLPPGYTARMGSGREARRRGGEHPKGNATDWTIYDDKGRALDNYQNAATFRIYEQFAQAAKAAQIKMYPKESFIWGGYFVNGYPGHGRMPYGTADLMHMQWGGSMAGGTWEKGATGPIKHWLGDRGGKSVGMSADKLKSASDAKTEGQKAVAEASKHAVTPGPEAEAAKKAAEEAAAPGKHVSAAESGLDPNDKAGHVLRVARNLKVSPVDVATLIYFESAGTFSTSIWGGTGGNYLGLWQAGGPERRQFHVYPGMSIGDSLDAFEDFLRTRGFREGGSLADMYAKINPGGGKYLKTMIEGSPRKQAESLLAGVDLSREPRPSELTGGGGGGGGAGGFAPGGGGFGGAGSTVGYGPGGIGGRIPGLATPVAYVPQGVRSMGQKGASGTWGLPPVVEKYIGTLDPKYREMARRQYLRMADPAYWASSAASTMANMMMGPTLPYGYVTWLYGDEPKGYREWQAEQAKRKK